MTIPPSSNKPPATQVYYLTWQAVQQVWTATEPVEKDGTKRSIDAVTPYLSGRKFPIAGPKGSSPCPAQPIGDAQIVKYTSRQSAPLFASPRSITARSIQQLRDVLRTYAAQKRTPSTPPHICVEVATQGDGTASIHTWNPWEKGRPK